MTKLVKNKIWHLAVILPMLFILLASPALALEITNTTAEVRNDFVVEPAKTEVFLTPGEKVTKTLSVVNRTDREQLFTVDIEDFTGSKDPNQVVILLGGETGPYSLKDYIKPEVRSFKLKSKQRAVLSVVITVPQDAEPGGHYGSILVSSAPPELEDTADNSARTVSRIGALYFVRVAGAVKEDGQLQDFRMAHAKAFYEKGPFDFEALFENNSSVHLTPGGQMTVKNMIGRTVATVDVPPFFSLPNSVRAAQITWVGSGLAFGRYTATVTLNRGYKESPDVTDTKTVAFWVLPWKIGVGLVVAIIILVLVLRTLMRSFEIKRKK